MNKAQQYIDELNVVDEHITIKAKKCTDKIDRSILETICSFSNEPDLGGGVIILGMEETHNPSEPYSVIGIKDPDKLQKDLSTQCADMFNHPVRPTIEPDVIEGKKVLVVTVPDCLCSANRWLSVAKCRRCELTISASQEQNGCRIRTTDLNP